MNKKILALFLAIILMVTLTGCMQYKIALEMDCNNASKISLHIAYNETIMNTLGDETQSEIDSLLEAQNLIGTDTSGVVVTPLYYVENNATFKGNKYEFTLEDPIALMDEENNTFSIIPLKDNTYRLEVKFDLDAEQREELDTTLENSGMTADEYIQLYRSLGGKSEFRLKSNNTVFSHNADEVKDGEYIWDLNSRIIKNKSGTEVIFVEYKVAEKANVNNPVREEFIKKYNLDSKDPDFYGKALQNVNVLYGSDKGLELDSELLRLQGALIYARLLGLEDEIEEFAKANPGYDSGFTDVPAWAKPTMNYLFYNKLVFGKGNNLYGSYDPMSEAQFTALVLRALGYSEANKDFVFADASKKAYELGFYITDSSGFEIKNKNRLTRRDMSYIAFNSLFIQNKAKSAYLMDNLSIMQ